MSGDPGSSQDERLADDLGGRLRLLPGVTAVEREDRTSWLVAGGVSRPALAALVRAWARET